MHTAAKVTIGIGIVAIIIGIILLTTTGDDFDEDVEEGIVYEGADGKTKVENVEPNTGSKYWVHLVDAEFEGGGGGGYNEAHGNSTWNLTQSDCNLVRSFTLTYDDNQIFYPQCNYIEDSTEDKYIVIGRLCNTPVYDRYGWEVANEGEGCREGTYTWDTDGNEVMVYDVEAIFGAIIDIIMQALGSFGACCCGSVILIIGIIMAATIEDNNANPYAHQTSTSTEQTPQASSGWEEQEDYIHRQKDDKEVSEKSDMAIPEDKEERKRSGEYELPPPPET
tara:strand:- start:712 stop:1548 length:837 start_codon:yes stop_codon:yes gene_type:complete